MGKGGQYVDGERRAAFSPCAAVHDRQPQVPAPHLHFHNLALALASLALHARPWLCPKLEFVDRRFVLQFSSTQHYLFF
jgi:hypothetical protein